MKREDLLSKLRDALRRYAKEPYQRFASLGDEEIIEESGTPSNSPGGDYCQIELQVLERLKEGQMETLHVSVVAGDGFQSFGGDLYFQSDSNVKIGAEMYEFIKGAAHPLGPVTQ